MNIHREERRQNKKRENLLEWKRQFFPFSSFLFSFREVVGTCDYTPIYVSLLLTVIVECNNDDDCIIMTVHAPPAAPLEKSIKNFPILDSNQYFNCRLFSSVTSYLKSNQEKSLGNFPLSFEEKNNLYSEDQRGLE